MWKTSLIQKTSCFFQFDLLRVTGQHCAEGKLGSTSCTSPLEWHGSGHRASDTSLHQALCFLQCLSHWRQWDPCSPQGSSSSTSLPGERSPIASNRVALDHLSSYLWLLQFITEGNARFIVRGCVLIQPLISAWPRFNDFLSWSTSVLFHWTPVSLQACKNPNIDNISTRHSIIFLLPGHVFVLFRKTMAFTYYCNKKHSNAMPQQLSFPHAAHRTFSPIKKNEEGKHAQYLPCSYSSGQLFSA